MSNTLHTVPALYSIKFFITKFSFYIEYVGLFLCSVCPYNFDSDYILNQVNRLVFVTEIQLLKNSGNSIFKMCSGFQWLAYSSFPSNYLFLFDNVILCTFIVMTMYSYCMFMYDCPE
jgi:hypothetical protein